MAGPKPADPKMPAAGDAKRVAWLRENTFRAKIFSPLETYFDEAALSLSAENDTGPFDILAGHANFLTMLTPCTIKVRTPHGITNLPIQRGVLHVRDDSATVYLNI